MKGFVAAAVLASALVATPLGDLSATTEPLAIEAKHSEISRKVTDIIERFHFSRQRIDNALSSAILDRYLDTLDSNRMYFLAPDVAAFSRHRYELDERVRNGNLQPVFEVFNRFRERTVERVEFALQVLDQEPDFSLDESYTFDRTDQAWPTNKGELDEIWRKRVKNDAISLMLAGKTWEESTEVLRKRYERMGKRIDQLTADDVFETFMNAYAHTMDPHSSYLSPRNSEEYRIQMSLSYDGIGASLQLKDDYVTVMDVIPGGPAHVDGQLKPADRIVGVGQGPQGELEDVIGWRLDDVVDIIRGPGGTSVRLQILPEGALPGAGERVIELTRNKVKLEAQAAKKEIMTIPSGAGAGERRVGVIAVPSFYQDYAAKSRGERDFTSTTADVRRLLGELEAEGVEGVVMDLRGNGGGHLSEATNLSGLFIKQGPVVQLKETHGRVQVLDDPIPDAVYDGPLVVLVDRFSASASEIFAAAIQDYGRGVVIGQQTFGKGSVQNLFNLDRFMDGDGFGQLTLTIGKYYRVTGGSTQHRGVEPDIELPSLVDATTVGESTRETALPWDQIRPTRYDIETARGDQIIELSRNHEQRASNDPDFNFLLDDIEAYSELRSRKSVSLNLEARRSERDGLRQTRLDRENERRATVGQPALESIEALEELESPDVVLESAAEVIVDMARLSQLGPEGKRAKAH